VYLYRGPGTSFQPIVTLSVDDTVSVLAINPAGDWALVKPADTYKSPGWAPLEQLAVEGSLAGVPQVLTAWVESNALAIRRGPGLYYEQTGSLAINDMVVVLGVDQGRAWALVKPVTGGGQGWLPLNFLTLTGSWEDAPEAAAPPIQPASAPAEFGVNSKPGTRNSELGTQNPFPGKLVFQTSSGGDIMAINPDGSGLQRLTSGIDPVLSPDGRTVAFTRWTGEDGTVWLINLDGSNERPLLGETKQAKHPAWSPDGQRLVVNFQHEGRLDPKEACQNLIELGNKRPGIPFNVDPDSVEVKIKDGRPFLCWTLPPDPHWGLRVVNVAGGSFQDEPSDSYAFGPEWDPANAWRVVSSGLNGLVQLDVNRSEQWSLSDRREDHTPSFSPDGRYLAVAYNNSGHYDIHRLNADGSGRLALTETPLWVTVQPDQPKPWNNVSPAWSPDGSRIAFLTDRTGRWEIWVMNADGSNQHPMFPAEVNDQLQLKYNFVDERMLSWK
jgi:TolB protein